MNFPILICGNCEKEKDDEHFLLLDLNIEKVFGKTNSANSNLNSNTDNNDSTNNIFEIIEYPYTNNDNAVGNENYSNIPEQIYQPIKTEVERSKKQTLDYDDDLFDIKPPKLFTETYKTKKENLHYFNTEPNDKNGNNFISENNYNIQPSFENHIKMYSNTSESLINNDNSMMNNKILLTNYYMNYQKKEKNTNNIEIDKSINQSKINNDFNNNNYKNNKNIGIKIDYPNPDINSIYLNSNDKTPKKSKRIEKSGGKYFPKKKENINAEKDLFLKKIEKSNLGKKQEQKIFFIKPRYKAYSNYNVKGKI